MNKAIVFSLSLLLTACFKVGPDYKKPRIETPVQWRFSASEVRKTANLRWWEQFQDPVLNSLMERALLGNLDLKIAIANVDQFMGLYASTKANLFPQIFGGFSYNRQQISGNTNPALLFGKVPDSNYVDFGPSMTWELDVWGQLRRANEAARADLLRQEYTRDAVTLTMMSLVAQTYINLRALDAILEITQETVKNLEEQNRINTVRFENGYTSEIELTQSNSELERRRALIPQYQQQIAQTEHALCLLLGINPSAIARGKKLDELKALAVPAGLPSDLLARRPDIQIAEQSLIAANAKIGVARGEYFPKIQLTGNIGEASVEFAQLFTPGSGYWTIGTRLLGPIFTAGKIAGQVKTAEASKIAALASYQKSIITAFKEFEDALITSQKSVERQAYQSKRVAAVHDYLKLSQLNYDEGNTAYLSVLDAFRQFFEAQIELVQARSDNLTAYVQLYKAMGGGWVIDAEKSSGVTRPKEVRMFP